jgi:hypothetical protein
MKKFLYLLLIVCLAVMLGVGSYITLNGTAQAQSATFFQNLAARTFTVIGNSTYQGAATFNAGITADDLTLTDDFNITDAISTSGSVAVGASLSVDNWVTADPASTITVLYQGTITPTGTNQPITAAAARGTRLIVTTTVGSGTILVLENVGAQTITLTDTAPLLLSGNIALGANDTLTLKHNGTSWVQLSTSNN